MAAVRRKPGTDTKFPAQFAGNWLSVPGFALRDRLPFVVSPKPVARSPPWTETGIPVMIATVPPTPPRGALVGRQMSNHSNRRKFLATAAGAAAFTILPRRLLARSSEVPPSDKITVAYIGTGTQGLRELLPMLAAPEIRVVSVCDPSKHALGYRDWARDSLLREIRHALNKPDWRAGSEGIIPGGRDAGQNIVDTFYGSQGCTAYADYRELLDKEKDLNAVKIMTPDHLHGVISIAAMKRGKHVIMHKPIANRLLEADRVIETARSTGVATHFMPWDSNGSMDQVLAWIRDGSIGTLREIHNWTNRPVWPQYAAIPTDTPPVPEGFDWDLWLGPERERPYHPNYTHMVFRGWYDFGGGSMADMGQDRKSVVSGKRVDLGG